MSHSAELRQEVEGRTGLHRAKRGEILQRPSRIENIRKRKDTLGTRRKGNEFAVKLGYAGKEFDLHLGQKNKAV